MKLFKAMKKHPAELMNKINKLEARVEELENELALETSWAEGEIEFWQNECEKAEAALAKASKPFWRYIIS